MLSSCESSDSFPRFCAGSNGRYPPLLVVATTPSMNQASTRTRIKAASYLTSAGISHWKRAQTEWTHGSQTHEQATHEQSTVNLLSHIGTILEWSVLTVCTCTGAFVSRRSTDMYDRLDSSLSQWMRPPN